VFTTHPINQEEVINNSFTVECRAEGFPTPSIQWYHNNTVIANSSNRYIVETTSMNSITSILRVIMANFTDSGVYHCEANSSVFVDNVKSDMMNISVVGEYGLILCQCMYQNILSLYSATLLPNNVHARFRQVFPTRSTLNTGCIFKGMSVTKILIFNLCAIFLLAVALSACIKYVP